MNPIEVLKFIGVPVLVATFISIVGWKLLRSKRLQPIGSVLAIGVASAFAFVLQEGIPTVPPVQKWHWLSITILTIALLASIYPLFRVFDKLVVLQALIAGLIAAILMQFPAQGTLVDRCIVFLLVLFVSLGLRRITIPVWHVYVVSWLVLAGISMLALQSNFAKLSFFSGAISAVAAAMCVLQLLKPRETKSVQMIFGVAIVGCSLCGLAYDQNETYLSLLWFAPIISVPLSAMAYLLCKRPAIRPVLSLSIVLVVVSASAIWSMVATSSVEEMWP